MNKIEKRYWLGLTLAAVFVASFLSNALSLPIPASAPPVLAIAVVYWLRTRAR